MKALIWSTTGFLHSNIPWKKSRLRRNQADLERDAALTLTCSLARERKESQEEAK
jgi:hypothetical protein